MYLDDFDYKLPKTLIAQHQVKNRDHSRLLVLDRKSGKISHKNFYDILNFLNPGDLLILNNSKVFPARLIGERKDSGGRAEIFLHKKIKNGIWEAVGKNLKAGTEIKFKNSKLMAYIKSSQNGEASVEFNLEGEIFSNEIEKIGITPLPPYIKRRKNITEDKKKLSNSLRQDRRQCSGADSRSSFHQGIVKKSTA